MNVTGFLRKKLIMKDKIKAIPLIRILDIIRKIHLIIQDIIQLLSLPTMILTELDLVDNKLS